MIEATYLDGSGSMSDFDRSTVKFEGKNHTFTTEIDSERYGGTSFNVVFAHAVASGYKSIRVITDGFGYEFDANDVEKRPTFDNLEIDWVIV